MTGDWARDLQVQSRLPFHYTISASVTTICLTKPEFTDTRLYCNYSISFTTLTVLGAGSCGGSWSLRSLKAQRVFSMVFCQQRNNSRRSLSLRSFPRLPSTCAAAYARGALDAGPLTSVCVCVVKFNQDGICWCLMWVIVPYSVLVCVCTAIESPC